VNEIRRATPAQFADWVGVGRDRAIWCLYREAQHRHGAGWKEFWPYNINGALGEGMAALVTGAKWHRNVRYIQGMPDIGEYEVRTNAAMRPYPYHDTYLHETDTDERPFIGVRMHERPDQFEIMGWIWGYEGKLTRFWRTPENGRACYFVPREALLPIELLPSEDEVLRFLATRREAAE
jgi:hypothetical protein